jgi:sulfonate transport system ATP-binding protein
VDQVTAHVLPRLDGAIDRLPQVVSRAVPARGLAITVQRLHKAFGSHEVLRGLDFFVPEGQFVAIVGRSGCGKSTLLRLLLRIDQPSSGRLWFGDRADDGPDDAALRIMFQEARLLPWAQVLSNVEVGLGDGRRSAEGRKRALDTLRSVGLEGRRGDWPRVLSGGERQRVALARALVSRPRVLAFDEPLGALDALTRITMQRLLERVWLDDGFTAIMVTHDVAEAVALADRVMVIEHGEIAMDVAIDLPRPRERGSAEVARLEGQILRRLLAGGPTSDGQFPGGSDR